MEMSTLPENPMESNTQVQAEGGGGNRWPREETMALLKIRSEMDAAFRDTSPKAPLWEQVSRKLAELGYERSAKKCKEKFENIYKYHRRTKDGRSARPNAKTYRFFDQLQALDTTTQQQPQNVIRDAVPCSVFRSSANDKQSNSTSSGTWSSSNSKGGRVRLSQMLEGLMRQVIEKQESLQRSFMQVLDRCEQERMAREQAWKAQELSRIQREREILAQERSLSAAKDEALLAFLKRFSDTAANATLQLPDDIMTHLHTTVPHHEKDRQELGYDNSLLDKDKQGPQYSRDNPINVANFVHVSSSRWPKDEVEALIRLRTQLDVQHNQVNHNNSDNSNSNNTSNNTNNLGSSNSNGGANKGPLWEEISLAMKGLGYDRSAKRCKEKWENINKYFKRMKEKNKRKAEDSKTCPYYHHLEALYSSKKTKKVDESASPGNDLRPEELLMHIMSGQEEARRQQQQQQQLESSSEDVADREENNDQNHQGDNGNDNDGEDGYHPLVANSPNSIAIMG